MYTHSEKLMNAVSNNRGLDIEFVPDVIIFEDGSLLR
jgi:hypothetical protein